MGKNKFYTVCGTEENLFEVEVNEFDTEKEAEEYILWYERDWDDRGYETWAHLARSEAERDKAVAEIEHYRETIIDDNWEEDDEDE